MKFLITAGPTREAIDPVRFITNHSSGKMGYAVAAAAVARGHEVCLVSGPVFETPPDAVELVSVCSAADMHTAVKCKLDRCDALVMVAAVADWRPRVAADRKLKKREMEPVLELERTVDILGDIRELKGGRIFVGFAAETDDLLAEASRKLEEKGLDMIVANDVSAAGAGFGSDTNVVTLIEANGKVEQLARMSKLDVGTAIVEWVESHR